MTGAMKEQCRALFPYKAHNDDELTLEEGDIITILSKEVQDEGWWKGVLRGKVGVFPDNFVEELPPVPIEEVSRPPQRPFFPSQGRIFIPCSTLLCLAASAAETRAAAREGCASRLAEQKCDQADLEGGQLDQQLRRRLDRITNEEISRNQQ